MIKSENCKCNGERKLHPDAEKLLDQPDFVRIQFIKQSVFIEYDAGKAIIKEILDLFEQPLRPRMEGRLLISPTNNGKTTLIKKFIQDYSPIIGNLVYIETPERTTLKEFYVEILNVLGYPVKATGATGDLRRKILIALQSKKVKMLFIDEIHNLLDSRRDHKRDILNGLKSLNNKAQIPIVLIGIETAEDVLNLDDQVADRYPTIELPQWNNDEKFWNLLATFESCLPLKKPSDLHDAEIPAIIFKISNGRIGRVATIIRKAAIEAIKNEQEHITAKLLKSIPFRWDSIKSNQKPM